MKIYIDKQDLWVMLLSTIRYSMGRMSYMPSYACDLVLKYKKHLDTEQIEQIYKEVEQEVKIYENAEKTLGMECDHRTWKNFLLTKEDKL